jgi:hypothetical protein
MFVSFVLNLLGCKGRKREREKKILRRKEKQRKPYYENTHTVMCLSFLEI